MSDSLTTQAEMNFKKIANQIKILKLKRQIRKKEKVKQRLFLESNTIVQPMKKDWRQYGEGGKNRWSKEKENDTEEELD